MFKGLQIGQVSRVIPIIGTLIPIFSLSVALVTGSVTVTESYGVVMLVIGLVFLTIFDWRGKMMHKELFFEVLSALFFAISYVFLRIAYENAHFWTVFVYSRPILIPVGIALLLIPFTRKIIFPSKKEQKTEKKGNFLSLFKSKTIIFFATGQISAGISELLLTFSISLASPALVNSLQGTQYVFLFIFNLILSKKDPQIFSENLSLKVLSAKVVGIFCIGYGLVLLSTVSV